MFTVERPLLLSSLWLFAVLNFIYCDVIGLHDASELETLLAGHVGELQMDQGFLLASSVLVEIPIAMVIVTRLARRSVARVASVAAAAFMVLVQISSLFVGVPTLSYAFFSAIEIATLAVIGVIAVRWKQVKNN